MYPSIELAQTSSQPKKCCGRAQPRTGSKPLEVETRMWGGVQVLVLRHAIKLPVGGWGGGSRNYHPALPGQVLHMIRNSLQSTESGRTTKASRWGRRTGRGTAVAHVVRTYSWDAAAALLIQTADSPEVPSLFRQPEMPVPWRKLLPGRPAGFRFALSGWPLE